MEQGKGWASKIVTGSKSEIRREVANACQMRTCLVIEQRLSPSQETGDKTNIEEDDDEHFNEKT